MIIEVPKGYVFDKEGDIIAFEKDNILKLKGRQGKFQEVMYDITYKLKGNNRCYYCGEEINPSKITIDHIYPQALGGPTIPQNMVPACRNCNGKKEDMTPEQFRAYMNLKDKGMQTQFRKEYFQSKLFQTRWVHILPEEWISEKAISDLIVAIDLTDKSTNKYKKIKEYYTRCRQFPKPIIVDCHNFVLDGFTAVLYAKNSRIVEIPAIVLENVEVIF